MSVWIRRHAPGVVFAALLCLPSAATAKEEGDSFYLRGAYAVNDIVTDDRFDRPPPNRDRAKIKYDSGDGFMAAVGFNLGQFRAELEYLQLENDVAPGVGVNTESVKGTAPFVNLMYVFRKDDRLRPYFGGGLGYLKLKTDVGSESDVAVQYLFGLDVGVTQSLSVDLGARYISGARYRDLDPINVNGTDNTGFIVNYDSYAASLGLKWRFAF